MQKFEGIWNKKQLLPAWILQFIFAGIFGIFAVLLLAAAEYIHANPQEVENDYQFYGFTPDYLVKISGSVGCIFLVFALNFYVLNIAEMFLYLKRALNPMFALVSGGIKTLASVTYLGMVIYSAAIGSVSVTGFVISVGLLLSSIGQLVLGAKFTRQKRQGTLGVEAGSVPYGGNYPPQPMYNGAGAPPQYQGNGVEMQSKPQGY